MEHLGLLRTGLPFCPVDKYWPSAACLPRLLHHDHQRIEADAPISLGVARKKLHSILLYSLTLRAGRRCSWAKESCSLSHGLVVAEASIHTPVHLIKGVKDCVVSELELGWGLALIVVGDIHGEDAQEVNGGHVITVGTQGAQAGDHTLGYCRWSSTCWDHQVPLSRSGLKGKLGSQTPTTKWVLHLESSLEHP